MHALKYYDSETLRKRRSGRPLRAMFVHRVRELGVLWLLSVRVEVVTDLIHVHGDPVFPWLVAVVCVAHKSGRVRRDDFG